MIPQIVDTVIFIKDGSINKVYNLKFKVKVPTGMVEADLARPVIEVNNFENNKIDYEIYTFGDQTVVMPVKDKKERITSLEKLAGERVSEEIKKIVPKAWTDVSVNNSRATVWVEEKFIPKIIGRGGKNIAKMEKILGISIDIRGFEEKSIKNRNYGKKCRVTIKETINHLHLVIGEKNAGKTMRIYSDDEELFIATISRKGEIKIEKGSDIAKNIVGGLASQNQIYAREENI
jgi:ATPase